jgi:hypothetical protein
MWPEYQDIIDRAGAPDWYSDGGVPRYGEFNPERVGIYARWVCFFECACQECDARFRVAVDLTRNDAGRVRPPRIWFPSSKGIGSFYYGDPPRWGHGESCIAGDTMSAVPVRVLEFWHQPNVLHGWERAPEYELVMPAVDNNPWGCDDEHSILL